MNKNIIKVVTVSSIQLNMLNFMETRFLFFLLFLTRLLSPGTLISCPEFNLILYDKHISKSVTSHHPVKEGFVGLVDDEVEKVSVGDDQDIGGLVDVRVESGDHHQQCNQQIDVQCHQNPNILPYFLVKSELNLT